MRYLIPVLLPVVLAGCSKAIELQNATIDQFTAALRNVQLQKPGRWTVTSQVIAMDLGSTDPAMTPMIRDQAMRAQSVSICVKEDQPSMMSLDQVPAFKTMACRLPHFVAKQGEIDGQIACVTSNGTMTMSEKGQYTPETYSIRLAIKQEMQGQPAITTTTQVDARRLGGCET